jgi:hypothetical protein
MRHVLLKMYGCQYGRWKGTLVYCTKMSEERAARARFQHVLTFLDVDLAYTIHVRDLAWQQPTSSGHVPRAILLARPPPNLPLVSSSLLPSAGSLLFLSLASTDPITKKGTSRAVKP